MPEATPAPAIDEVPVDDQVGWLGDMFMIRHFEEVADDLSLRGKMAGGIHPAIGQEAVAVGTVNGEALQQASTADMVFTVRQLIAYLSQTMTLLPGDVIATGTPSGIGAARTPPRFLRPGDSVVISIDGVTELTNPVVGEAS